MIAENTADRPTVPSDPWQPGLKMRLNNLGMRALGNVSTSLSTLLGSRAERSFGILMYHRIAAKTRGIPAPPYSVDPIRFRAQLSGLLSRGFQFVSLRQAIDCHNEQRALPSNSVVVTFDDCFESVYTEAWPVLRELQIPATLFLSTAYLDSESPFPFDTWGEEFADRVPADCYRPISTEQCREMAESGLVELGTHTHTHADFRQHVDEFAEEMEIAASILKSKFGVERPAFSLPFGSPSAGYASEALLTAAKDSGALCALTTEAVLVDVASDPFGWGRLNVFEWDTAATFAGKLHGWYDWAPRCKHHFGKLIKGRG